MLVEGGWREIPVTASYAVEVGTPVEHVMVSSAPTSVILTPGAGSVLVQYKGSVNGTYRAVPLGVTGSFSANASFKISGPIYGLKFTASGATVTVEIVQ